MTFTHFSLLPLLSDMSDQTRQESEAAIDSSMHNLSRKGDVNEWILDMKALLDRQGVPGVEQPKEATRYIEHEFGIVLGRVVGHAQNRYGPIQWVQFAKFMVAFDSEWYLMATVNPFN